MTLNTSPAAERNRPFILEVLEQHLPRDGTVLEIASGTGQHAVHFAPALAPRLWQPSDRDTEALASISAWRQAQPSNNLAEPLLLDVLTHPWPGGGHRTDTRHHRGGRDQYGAYRTLALL